MLSSLSDCKFAACATANKVQTRRRRTNSAKSAEIVSRLRSLKTNQHQQPTEDERANNWPSKRPPAKEAQLNRSKEHSQSPLWGRTCEGTARLNR
jgi:hypothetical protein